jgi:hypothetical protein
MPNRLANAAEPRVVNRAAIRCGILAMASLHTYVETVAVINSYAGLCGGNGHEARSWRPPGVR